MQSCENLSTRPLVEPPLSAISNCFLYDFITMEEFWSILLYGVVLIRSSLTFVLWYVQMQL